MEVEERPVNSIRPYEKNPRLNDAAVDAVASSILEFGFRQPIVVDEQDVIIVGHTRYKAALKLGLETVPVHVAKGLSPAQAKALLGTLPDAELAKQLGPTATAVIRAWLGNDDFEKNLSCCGLSSSLGRWGTKVFQVMH
jgi:hypothetical protein